MTSDEMRLLVIHRMMDGVADLDFHELAAEFALAAHREEPNDADYLAATRTAMDVLVKQEFGVSLSGEAPCWTCNDDPAVCAKVPGLRHCEAANRERGEANQPVQKDKE